MRITISCAVFLAATIWAIAQSITDIRYDPLNPPGYIFGSVDGIDPTKHQIAIVIDVFDTYWSKPTAASPTVPIQPPTDVSVPITLGGTSIPAGLQQMSVASAVVDSGPEARVITWAGYSWTLKDTGECVWGPGPNHFSADNVYIDLDGKLHLTVKYVDGAWRCPEVILTKPLGYGSYRFYLDSDVSSLPAPLVAGWFLYDDGNPPYYGEIDVEYTL